MKYSRLFGKTKREAKKDIQLVSHKYLYQAGYVEELSSGRYQFLPLGFIVWRKLVNIIEHELTLIGAQRFSIPILQPIEIWKKTNRDGAWGDLLMKIEDHRGSEFALSATGEGVVTDLVGNSKPSYRDLPIILNQFIAKFRDEMRPRGGLLRTREFTMQDAYSYHATEEDFMQTYQDFYDAYSKICERLELEYYSVFADSGALGGDYCHEFQIPCEVGEDQIVKCNECDYAANVERGEFVREKVNADEELKEMVTFDQPWEQARKISDMVKYFERPASNMIKSVAFKTKDETLVIAVVTGNLEVNDVKVAKLIGEDEVFPADENDLADIGAISGNVHAWGYKDVERKVIFVADESIITAKNLYGGFKTKTTDTKFVNYGRDFQADFEGDIAEPNDGAKCKKCGGELRLIRTVEFGHIFKYDHFYTEKHKSYFTDRDGKDKPMYMGAYGIGIGRAIGTIVEKHHDEKGIIWPENIAPFKYHIVSLANQEDDKVMQASKDLYEKLSKLNVEVLWDDRLDASAGQKFADADLIGIPNRIVISKRTIRDSSLEIKKRSEAEGKEKLVKIDKFLSDLA